MDSNITPFPRNGQVPLPSAIAIRVAEMASRRAIHLSTVSESLTLAEITQIAFEIDKILQLPQIMESMRLMREKVEFEARQRVEAQKREHEATKVAGRAATDAFPAEFLSSAYKASQEALAQLEMLVKAMEAYIDYLHDAEKQYVIPHFLKAENPIQIYPDECQAKGKFLRDEIGRLVPAWLTEDDAPKAVEAPKEEPKA